VYSAVTTIGDAGFDFVELWGEIPHAYHEWVDRRRLKDLLSTYDINITMHAPYTDLNPAVPFQPVRAAVTKTLADFIRFGEYLNTSRITIHPGSVHNEALVPTSVENAVSTLRELVKVGGGRLEVNIENQVKSQSPYHFPLGSNLESIDVLLAEVEGARLTLDTGHAHVNGIDSLRLYERFQDSVTEVHLSDNDGSADDHLAPGRGTAKLKGLVEKIVGGDMAVCLELNPHLLEPDEVIREAVALKNGSLARLGS
jgi:sugar phosphate isomerase/epimerase